MRLQLLLIVSILLGSSIQASAANVVKAPVQPPPPAAAPPKSAPVVLVPTATPTAIPTSTPTPLPLLTQVKALIARVVVSTPTAIPTATSTATSMPSLSAVTVWPSISKGGQAILFKAPSDPGSAIQLSIKSVSGQPVFQTSFSKTGRSGGHVWRLQNQAGSPVAGGVYVYVLHFKQQGQNVTAQGQVTVVR